MLKPNKPPQQKLQLAVYIVCLFSTCKSKQANVNGFVVNTAAKSACNWIICFCPCMHHHIIKIQQKNYLTWIHCIALSNSLRGNFISSYADIFFFITSQFYIQQAYYHPNPHPPPNLSTNLTLNYRQVK